GRSRAVHRRGCVGLHHQTRGYGTASESHEGMAVSLRQERGLKKEEGEATVVSDPLPITRASVSPSNMPGPPTGYSPELERVEIELLLEGIFRHYGFDFRSYAYASIRRRLWKRVEAAGLHSLSQLQARVV